MAKKDELRDYTWNKMTNDDVIRESLLLHNENIQLLKKLSRHTEETATVLKRFLFFLQGCLVIGLILGVGAFLAKRL